jgi:hypothetical protein
MIILHEGSVESAMFKPWLHWLAFVTDENRATFKIVLDENNDFEKFRCASTADFKRRKSAFTVIPVV